ncbi:hypothetical protein EW146_g3014 [Bondarzewia mesenterica]|uniref:Gti1/Pac2 family-domain-containing protein n=1 Tax=Bondarzewia mesenterica TaxID=1095465 RepID=A0A4V3XFK5_9AGAM|nr:hypothetical protein EW146_g3014 [Bondarzewia mesenterica]
MQPPTCTGLRIRTARDADIIFHAVAKGILPMVTRRLDSEERMALSPGCVYVWEERTSSLSESIEQGIERFTEGRSWGPSRARDDFLFYHEKDNAPKSLMVERTRAIRYQEDPLAAAAMYPRRIRERMIKQTYSVYVNGHPNMKKWHLNAYWTQETLLSLATVDDIPELMSIVVPEGLYICARTSRLRETLARTSRSTPCDDGAPMPEAHAAIHVPTYMPFSTERSLPHDDPPMSLPQFRCPPSSSHCEPPSTHAGLPANFRFPPLPPPDYHAIRLAPLEQLQSAKLRRRDPADDAVLRCFDMAKHC